MEDTLRVLDRFSQQDLPKSLNPCFNGRYSQRDICLLTDVNECSLNPCFNGRYSQRKKKLVPQSINIVLILVLMEDTLRAFVLFAPAIIGMS